MSPLLASLLLVKKLSAYDFLSLKLTSRGILHYLWSVFPIISAGPQLNATL